MCVSVYTSSRRVLNAMKPLKMDLGQGHFGVRRFGPGFVKFIVLRRVPLLKPPKARRNHPTLPYPWW